MRVLLPPLTGLPLPGTDDAARRGCSCTTADGALVSFVVPSQPPEDRPLFGYDKERWYLYRVTCTLHGKAVQESLDEQTPVNV